MPWFHRILGVHLFMAFLLLSRRLFLLRDVADCLLDLPAGEGMF